MRFCPIPTNRVELAAEKDHFGIPVAKVTFSLHDNDKRLIEFGKNKVMEVIVGSRGKRGGARAPLRASSRCGAYG